MLNFLYVALIIVFVICVITNIVMRIKKGGTTALFIKMASSMTFVLLSITAVSINPENYKFGVFLVIGAVFGMIGDIFLDLQSIHKEQSTAYFLVGMATFTIGHIFYIVGILSSYLEFIGWQIALAVFSATAVTVLVRFLSLKMGFDFGKLSGLTLVYSIITMLTVTFSLNAMNAFGTLPMAAGEPMPEIMPRFVTMFAGTTLFAVSDLVLSIVYFKDGGYRKSNIALNYALYYTSQFILSLSILM